MPACPAGGPVPQEPNSGLAQGIGALAEEGEEAQVAEDLELLADFGKAQEKIKTRTLTRPRVAAHGGRRND